MQLKAEVRIDAKTQRLLNQFGEELKPGVLAGMELTVQAAEAEVAKYTPVDQGILRASAYGRVVDQWPRVQGVLGSPLAYAEPVERGSRPHWPPRAPIVAWVQRTFGLSGKEAMRVGFLVARKISRQGTPPHRMYERGLRLAEQLAPRFLTAAVNRVAQALSDR
jgi:hypothetical protein